jgi:hypothetical protein
MGMLVSKGKAIHPKFQVHCCLNENSHALSGSLMGQALSMEYSFSSSPPPRDLCTADAHFTGEETTSKNSGDLPRITPTVNELVTSLNSESITHICLTPKHVLLTPDPYFHNNHTKRYLLAKKKENSVHPKMKMIQLLGSLIQILISRADK